MRTGNTGNALEPPLTAQVGSSDLVFACVCFCWCKSAWRWGWCVVGINALQGSAGHASQSTNFAQESQLQGVSRCLKVQDFEIFWDIFGIFWHVRSSNQEPHKFVETFRNGLGMSTGAISVKSEYGLKRFLPFYDANGKFAKKFEETKKEMQKQVEDPSLENRMNRDVADRSTSPFLQDRMA